MSLYKGEIMIITAILSWAKSAIQTYNKPQSYGSALEAYIVSKNPQDAADVDRLAREFDSKMSQRCTGGFPC
jgi:hypothetical protein